jgi:transposase-like protein
LGAPSTTTATFSTCWSSPAETLVAANKFFRRLLTGGQYVPRVLVTDKLGSYQVAHRELLS